MQTNLALEDDGILLVRPDKSGHERGAVPHTLHTVCDVCGGPPRADEEGVKRVGREGVVNGSLCGEEGLSDELCGKNKRMVYLRVLV